MVRNSKDEEEFISKADFETIISINKRTIELEIERVSQNETILESLTKISESQEEFKKIHEEIRVASSFNDEAIKDIKKRLEEIDKNQFRVQVILASNFLALILSFVITFFLSKH
jgi:predicted PurR-regulated permease PerM